jgi:hypothetical protein
MFDDPYRMASVMEGTKKNTEMNVVEYDNNQCSSPGDDGGMGEVIDDIEADRSQETFTTELADEISESNANWNYDGESYDDGVSQGGEIDEEVKNSYCIIQQLLITTVTALVMVFSYLIASSFFFCSFLFCVKPFRQAFVITFIIQSQMRMIAGS